MADYYTVSGSPGTKSQLSSATIRNEFALIAAGFGKLPALTGHGNEVVTVNAGGTALQSVTVAAMLAAAGAVTFNGAVSGITDLTTTGNTILGDASADTLNVGAGGIVKDAAGNTTLGGLLNVPLGLAGGPSIAFTGDLNTGMWSPAADTIAWSTGGSERVRLNANGFGVGGTPSYRLHVFGPANALPALISYGNTPSASVETLRLEVTGNASTDRGPYLGFFAPNGSGTSKVSASVAGVQTAVDGGGSLLFSTVPASSSTLTERMRINSAGLVTMTSGLTVTGTTTSTAFSGPLTGNVTGNAATATALQTARAINGVNFDGSAAISVNLNNALTAGTYLTSGGTFDGAAARTFAVDATSANTASKVVARDGSGNFSAGTITGALNGNASTATLAGSALTLATPRNINGVAFDGSANITVAAAAGTLTGATLASGVTASSLTSAGATMNLVGGAAGALTIGGNITRFESAELNCPSGTALLSAAHGGSRAPDTVAALLRCKTTEGGWAVGDEINMTMDDANRAVQPSANATTAYMNYVATAAVAPSIRNTSGTLIAVTPANWKVVLKCIWL